MQQGDQEFRKKNDSQEDQKIKRGTWSF